MPSAEVVDLASLASEANREHAAALGDLASATGHAFAAGAALNKAFDLVQEGGWGDWLSANFDGSATMARLYRRMDLYSQELRSHGITTVAAAQAFLAEAALRLQPERDGTDYGGRRNLLRTRELTKAEIAEIKALRKAGLSQREIADICGVGRTTVQAYTTPGYQSKRRAWNKSWEKKKKQERQALREKERAAAAKRAGGSLGDFYSRTRVFAQDLDRAIAQCENKEVRAALNRAYMHLTRLEDALGDALKVPS